MRWREAPSDGGCGQVFANNGQGGLRWNKSKARPSDEELLVAEDLFMENVHITSISTPVINKRLQI